MGAVRILPVGFLLLSASFASVALFAAAPPAEGWLRLMPAAGFVTLLTLGQMLLVPAAKDLIPLFAEESTLGAHYGALATAGGCAVLAGNLLLGHLLDQRSFRRRRRFIPASAGAVSAVQRRRPAGDLSPAGGNMTQSG